MQLIPINCIKTPSRHHRSLAPCQTHDQRTYVDCCIFKFVVIVVVVVVCRHRCSLSSLFVVVVRYRRCSLLLFAISSADIRRRFWKASTSGSRISLATAARKSQGEMGPLGASKSLSMEYRVVLLSRRRVHKKTSWLSGHYIHTSQPAGFPGDG